MRNHYDELVVGDFLQQVHDLFRSLCVESTRRFVGEYDFGVVDDGAGNSYALHLTARKLVGFFLYLTAESHAFESVDCKRFFLLVGHARYGERKFDVLKNVQVRNEVVRLKNKTD